MQSLKTNRQNVAIGSKRLEGQLAIPEHASGLVIFAHVSGSSRHSPRNQFVAEQLQAAGFATLLFDLLDEEEARDRKNIFYIPFLGKRLSEAIAWAKSNPDVRNLPIGLFGASTGAAAALVAASLVPENVAAIVSRGGRPDLAGKCLKNVEAPTLLIVGGADETVLDLNKQALSQLTCSKKLSVIANATHLFEEPGTMEQVVEITTKWFGANFGGSEVGPL